MRDGLAVFRREFFKWVESHNKPSKRQPLGYRTVPGELFETLQAKIPDELLRSIGLALQDGWIATAEDGRGYFALSGSTGTKPAFILKKKPDAIATSGQLTSNPLG